MSGISTIAGFIMTLSNTELIKLIDEKQDFLDKYFSQNCSCACLDNF